jgi:hypothetical protein
LDVAENREKTDRIIFVVFEPRDVEVYYRLAPLYFPLEEAAPEPEAQQGTEPDALLDVVADPGPSVE